MPICGGREKQNRHFFLKCCFLSSLLWYKSFWLKKEYIVSSEKRCFLRLFLVEKRIYRFSRIKSSLRLFLVEKRIYSSPEQKSSSMLYCCLLSNKLFASTKYLFFQLLTVFIVASFLCWFRIISNNFKVSMLGNSFHKIAVQSQSQSQSGS